MIEASSPSSDRYAAVDAQVAEGTASYRRVREQIEPAIAPLATSVDGFSFDLQASLH
jgi:hypothetical protein